MYRYFPHMFSDEVLVYIETFEKKEGNILIDFIDSNEFNSFNDILNINVSLRSPVLTP